MNHLLSAANQIFNTVMTIQDDYERWRALVYKFNKFTMRFPLVALYMSKGFYSPKAFKAFIEKLQRNEKTEMNLEEFNQLHAQYAKFFYMKTVKHYDPSKIGEITTQAYNTLSSLFVDKESDDYKKKDSELINKLVNSLTDSSKDVSD